MLKHLQISNLAARLRGKVEACLSLLHARRLVLAVLCFSLLLFNISTAKPPPLETLSTSNTSNNSPTQNVQTASLHQWGAVTLFHGLPSDRVRAIAQDTEGVMWFGTDGGLAKYDGRRTQTIVQAGLPPGRVLALKVDQDGVLWVGTEGGAARLVNGEFRAINETAGKAITAIITPEHGRAIMTSEEGLIFDCSVQPDEALAVRTVPNQPMSSADADQPGPLRLTSITNIEGTLYAGTLSRGLLSIEHERVKEIQSKPRSYFIEAVEHDARGHLWFGIKTRAEESGLFEAQDLLRPIKMANTTGTVLSISADSQGGVWAGTEGHGAFHYLDQRLIEHFTFEGTAGGLRSDNIYSIFIDREEVIWFGTDKGVCRYDPHALRVENLSDDPLSNFVRTLYRTPDGQLLCGANTGLLLRDSGTSSWQPVPDLSRKIIYSITQGTDGRLLVGTSNGLYTSARPSHWSSDALHFTRLEAEAGENSPPNDSVRAISQFKGATYIASFGRGLERLEGSHRTTIWPNAQADSHLREIVSLYAEKDGRLWIGTASAGVFFFDGQQFRSEPALNALNGSAVWAIDGDMDHWLWFATARGLYVFHAGQLKEVVANLDARDVAVAGGAASSRQAWCATAGGGLLKVLVDEQFGPLVSRLDAEQGLPSQSAFSVLPLPSENGPEIESLLIGTTRGIARFDPDHVQPALSPTRIISKRIHQPDELRAGLNLEYPQNSLVLDVAATSSRTFPEQFQYGFLLYDHAGRIIKQKLSHDAQFTMEALRPGTYRVVAHAYTSDLVASEPLAFEFNVAGAPFPWTSTALSVLLALALIALLWGYLQNRKIARTSGELMEANRQLADARLQVANQTEAERRRIARDLHDQTLADLRHLLLLTDQLPANGNKDGEHKITPAAFRAEIEAISQEVRRICEDLSPSVLENVGLAAALEWALANEMAHAAPDCKFDYEFVCEEDLEERVELSTGVQMQIYRIVQEAISNVCRHAAAKHVRLSLAAQADGSLLLQLEDDGRDFDPQEKRKKAGRGLSNIRARASLIEAEVSWAKRAGGGTLFTLRKPNALKESVRV